MSKHQEAKIVHGKSFSLIPHSSAEWVDNYNTLLDDIQLGKYKDHALFHQYSKRVSKNAILQDLITLGLNSLGRNGEGNAIVIPVENLPQDLVTFLNTDTGKKMVSNLVTQWYLNDFGLNALKPNALENSSIPNQHTSVVQESNIQRENQISDPTNVYSENFSKKHTAVEVQKENIDPPGMHPEDNVDKPLSRAQQLRQKSRLVVK